MAVILRISNCRECPHRDMRRTMGASYAHDWICTNLKPKRKIAGYIESSAEEPKSVPDWCPLEKVE